MASLFITATLFFIFGFFMSAALAAGKRADNNPDL